MFCCCAIVFATWPVTSNFPKFQAPLPRQKCIEVGSKVWHDKPTRIFCSSLPNFTSDKSAKFCLEVILFWNKATHRKTVGEAVIQYSSVRSTPRTMTLENVAAKSVESSITWRRVAPMCWQYVIETPLGGVDPLTSGNTPSSDPKPNPL